LIFYIPIGILHLMENRSIILERALELFAAKGYDAVGVQEICIAAGITKPTLYYYFGSKRSLLSTLLAGYFDKLNAQLSPVEYRGDLPLTLRRIASVYFRFAGENPVFYRMQLSMFFAPEKSDAFREVAGLNGTQYAFIEDVFARASRDHGNMKGRQKLYAASFLGTINNCIALALNGFLGLDDELTHKVVHQFEHGIYS
jgi:AcrR family transcriptional regulator